MNFLISIQIGIREIFAHQFRSLLTLTGIILGVASLITTAASVEGLTRGMRSVLVLFGGVEKLTIFNNDVPLDQEDLKDISPGKTMNDVYAIQNSCPHIIDTCPTVKLDNPTLQYDANIHRADVVGTNQSYMRVSNYEIASGRYLSDLDLKNQTHVCVIGEIIWRFLNQDSSVSPIGKILNINNIPFQIVGTFKFTQKESGGDALRKKDPEKQPSARARKRKRQRPKDEWEFHNNVVVIPITTMQSIFKSASLKLPDNSLGPDPSLTTIDLLVDNEKNLQIAVQEVHDTLIKTHRGIEDFRIGTKEQWSEQIESQIRSARLNGGIISGISLLVGGIGIANIMLASITERIREIGIRMAIGARRIQIFTQILIESSLLGFLGGILGIAASFGLVEIIRKYVVLNYQPIVTPLSIILSFSSALLIGVLAGIIPGAKAARLDPIQALRYE